MSGCSQVLLQNGWMDLSFEPPTIRSRRESANSGELPFTPPRRRISFPSSSTSTVQLCFHFSQSLLDKLYRAHLLFRVLCSQCSNHGAPHQRRSQPTTPPSTPPPRRSERSTKRCAVNVGQKKPYPKRPFSTTIPSGKASSCRCSPRSPRNPTRRNVKLPA
jgi:hypothetical protein